MLNSKGHLLVFGQQQDFPYNQLFGKYSSKTTLLPGLLRSTLIHGLRSVGNIFHNSMVPCTGIKWLQGCSPFRAKAGDYVRCQGEGISERGRRNILPEGHLVSKGTLATPCIGQAI
jgi:hypothetical protein